MSLLEDVFMEDDREDDNHLERVIEGGQEINSDGEDVDDDHSEAEEEAPRRVDPTDQEKKKVVRNPRFVLNPKRLTGPRGIKIIEEFFKDFKFQGKGHEKDDLDLVLKRLEHWAHRLYPKLQFDDCIEKIAALGVKKEVNVYKKRIRLNMIFDDQVVEQFDGDEDEEAVVAPKDEFDELLEQQIALARSTPASTHGPHHQPQDYFPPPQHNSTPSWNTSPNKEPASEKAAEITEEQRQRMLRSRMIAEEKRLARMKANVKEISSSLQTTQENPIVDNVQESASLIVHQNNDTEINCDIPTSQELMDA